MNSASRGRPPEGFGCNRRSVLSKPPAQIHSLRNRLQLNAMQLKLSCLPALFGSDQVRILDADLSLVVDVVMNAISSVGGPVGLLAGGGVLSICTIPSFFKYS